MDRAPQAAERILETLGGFPLSGPRLDRDELNLFAWMQTEKLVMFVILALIVLVAAFNITGALIMLVMEKKRDVGILRSMGATARRSDDLRHRGLVIRGIGMVLGTAAGLVSARSSIAISSSSCPGTRLLHRDPADRRPGLGRRRGYRLPCS
ncbi:MAG: hypothetical protein R3E12_10335 [Candidatus Eisenbacteria bacterium]